MAYKHAPYVDIEIEGEGYAFRLNHSDIAALDSQMPAGSSFLQSLGARRFDAILAAVAKGLSHPKNNLRNKEVNRLARKAFNEQFEYCSEVIADALEASGVIRGRGDEEDDDEDADSAGDDERPIVPYQTDSP